MAYNNDIREEELKNRLRSDYFSDYDADHILGDIDFAVALPSGPQFFETEYILWAEAKKGASHDIYESLVQLIITIGKSKMQEKELPPKFLGAFDAEKIAFIPFHTVMEVYARNDFNWNIAPSDHKTKEFQEVLSLVKDTLERNSCIYHYGRDDRELRKFIRNAFRADPNRSKIRISKSNYIHIFFKWLEEVKPTISVDWEAAKKVGVYERDFYLADILSKDNCTIKEKLNVLLKNDHYITDRHIGTFGGETFTEIDFTDATPGNREGKAHSQFWKRYSRPPKKDYWDFMVSRQDLLVEQDVRERKGSFFTPHKWVFLSQQYLAEELGDNWQEEYYIWDCCGGTGNLEKGLTNPYRIWVSTLDQSDVDVMIDQIHTNNAQLLDSHVFQFDFLNGDFKNLPESLRKVLNDPEKRKKLIIYINPPYAEASNARTITGTGNNRKGLADTDIKSKFKKILGRAGNEIFAQFFVRIMTDIPSCIIAMFSTLKALQGPNFAHFRQTYKAKLCRLFIVPANTFDNVRGQFPIGFQIYRTDRSEEFENISADVYNANGEFLGKKNINSYKGCRFIIEWLRQYYDKKNDRIAYLRYLGTDFQNNKGVFLTLHPSQNDLKQVKGTWVTRENLLPCCIYFTVRLCIPATWENDRDQFLFPNGGCQNDPVFQTDCLIFALFYSQNRIQSKDGVNHWIPFTEKEVGAKDNFDSHFMSEYLHSKFDSVHLSSGADEGNLPFGHGSEESESGDSSFAPYVPFDSMSPQAKAVYEAGKELWRYYHEHADANPNASFYDIKAYFQGFKTTGSGKQQMNAGSDDKRYTELIGKLRSSLQSLSEEITPKVYEYGFLK
ncbi:MAG: hypothetical protein PUD15_08825 [Prevotella sp.]|nr:hypothetical protein [Prevotella sp.]